MPPLRSSQSHSYKPGSASAFQSNHSFSRRQGVPDGTHQAVDEELVLLCRSLFPCVPYFAVATLHEPLLEIDWVRDVRICSEGVGREWKGFECRVKVCDAVLREQADEVQSSEGVFAG